MEGDRVKMVANRIIIPGSHLIQQGLTHDKFIYNDQMGAVYHPDPENPEMQDGFFKYTFAPPLLSNFAWNNVKLKWTRSYNTTPPVDFYATLTLEGILTNGTSELINESLVTSLPSSPLTEDISFDLMNARGIATLIKTDVTAPTGKVGIRLPKPWMNYESIILKPVWLNGWTKRKRQDTIKGSEEYSITSFPVKLTVNYVSGMKTDFSDVRFTGPDGRTPICSYRHSYTSGTTADFWINYPYPYATTGIFMYYGNASATLHSNIDSVFSFADDFDDNIINPDKWQIVSGGGGSITETGGILRVTSDGTNRIYLRTKNQYTAPYIFEFKARKQQNIEFVFSWNGTLSGAGDPPNTGYFLQYTGWSSPARFVLTKYVNGTPITLSMYDFTLDSNWHDYKIQIRKSGLTNIIQIFYDGTQILYSIDADGPLNTGYFGLTARETPAAINADYDFIRYYPYMATYPTPGFLAGEESFSSTGVSPDTPGENDTTILYSNSDGFKRPRYLTVTEQKKTAYDTTPQGMVNGNTFNLGYEGIDMYMALRLGIKIHGDKNTNIVFNNLEYVYEVI